MKQPMQFSEGQILEALEQYIKAQGIYSSNVNIRCSNFKQNTFGSGGSVTVELTPRFAPEPVQQIQQPQIVYVLPAGTQQPIVQPKVMEGWEVVK